MTQGYTLIQESETWRPVDLVNLSGLDSKTRNQFLGLAHSNFLHKIVIISHSSLQSINHGEGTLQLENDHIYLF